MEPKSNGGQPGNTNRRLEFGESSKRALLSTYKRCAARRHHAWGLTDEEFYRLVQMDCHYCGAPPHHDFKPARSTNGAFRYSGVDRVDSRLGYWPDNVVPCCQTCNVAKASMSLRQFLAWVRRVYEKTVAGLRD